MSFSLFNWRFILCPYCIRQVWINQNQPRCSGCERDLDSAYVKEYSKHFTFFVPLLGLTDAGKTLYVQTLMLHLRRISKLLSSASAVPVDVDTASYLKKSVEIHRTGLLPLPHNKGDQLVHLLFLKNLPQWRNMTLVLRDVSGEYFYDHTFSDEITAFLSNSRVMFMMLRLPDVLNRSFEVDELIYRYVHTVFASSGLALAKHIVIILSQADVVGNDLPQPIYEYLYNDKLWDLLQGRRVKVTRSYYFEQYIKDMKPVSEFLQKWLRLELAPVTALARGSEIQFTYCITSSLGVPPNGRTLGGTLHPYRVIDPLLWALELDKKNTRRS